MTVKCIMCEKTWPGFDRKKVIIHFLDDHHANLSFISEEELRMNVEEITETTKLEGPGLVGHQGPGDEGGPE